MGEMNGNPRYITDISSNSRISPNDLVPGEGGAKFDDLPASVTLIATPGNEKPINKIEFPNKQDNLKEVKIVLVPVDSSKQPEEITSTNPNEPIFPTSLEPVKEIQITITKTNNGDKPKNVEISVQSCFQETETTTQETQTSRTTRGFDFIQ